MRLKPAVFGLLKVKGEGVVEPMGAQPDVAVGARHDVGLEDLGVPLAHRRVNAVASDHQIGVGVVEVGLGLALEHQFDTQGFATGLQDIEQFLAPDADKAVPA